MCPRTVLFGISRILVYDCLTAYLIVTTKATLSATPLNRPTYDNIVPLTHSCVSPLIEWRHRDTRQASYQLAFRKGPLDLAMLEHPHLLFQ